MTLDIALWWILLHLCVNRYIVLCCHVGFVLHNVVSWWPHQTWVTPWVHVECIQDGLKKVIPLVHILHCTRGITFLAHPVYACHLAHRVCAAAMFSAIKQLLASDAEAVIEMYCNQYWCLIWWTKFQQWIALQRLRALWLVLHAAQFLTPKSHL